MFDQIPTSRLPCSDHDSGLPQGFVREVVFLRVSAAFACLRNLPEVSVSEIPITDLGSQGL